MSTVPTLSGYIELEHTRDGKEVLNRMNRRRGINSSALSTKRCTAKIVTSVALRYKWSVTCLYIQYS